MSTSCNHEVSVAEEEPFMRRALDLASLGAGTVSPNPMVGCVIVNNGKIIGEGWHMQYGGPHAEVNAIDNVLEKDLLPESTVYVTLEPCSHFGKTPPCADLLVKHNVKRVVISTIDPNPLVGGKGVKKLEQAGIDVKIGLLEAEGFELNKRFFCGLSKGRPYIILKWAQTSDGFVARANYDSKWISDETSRKLVHKWRSEEDAIMVGTNTAHYDNPKLNVRSWSGRDPIRVVIDRNLRLDTGLSLFDGMQETICYNLIKDEESTNLKYVKLDADNFFERLFENLYEHNIRSIIVEGGSMMLHKLIDAGLWDEARVFVSPNLFTEGIAAPSIKGASIEQKIENDKLLIYKNG